MRRTTKGSYDHSDFIKSIWVMNYWVVDADTSIMAAPPTIIHDGDLTTSLIIDDLPTDTYTNRMESEAYIDASKQYLSAAVVYEPVMK